MSVVGVIKRRRGGIRHELRWGTRATLSPRRLRLAATLKLGSPLSVRRSTPLALREELVTFFMLDGSPRRSIATYNRNESAGDHEFRGWSRTLKNRRRCMTKVSSAVEGS